jgi:hypothetical protein
VKRERAWPPGLKWIQGEGLSYAVERKYRLRATAPYQPEPNYWPPANAPVVPDDVFCKITKDGRVHLWRSNSLSIFDEAKGVAEFYEVATRAEVVFEWMQVFFPRRVAMEEIGEALELINRWRSGPTSRHLRLKIAIKVVSTIAVIALNSVRFVVSSFAGKKAE